MILKNYWDKQKLNFKSESFLSIALLLITYAGCGQQTDKKQTESSSIWQVNTV